MADVIYLVTSLPSLSLETAPRISIEEFHITAANNLSEANFQKLVALDVKAFQWEGTGALQKFGEDWELLQKDVREIRFAKREQRSPVLHVLPGGVSDMDPLQRELVIMDWQWKKLEDLAFDQNFTLDEVRLYWLKLQLAHRRQSFDVEQGNTRLRAAVRSQKTKED